MQEVTYAQFAKLAQQRHWTMESLAACGCKLEVFDRRKWALLGVASESPVSFIRRMRSNCTSSGSNPQTLLVATIKCISQYLI